VRISAFAGTSNPNTRPRLVINADAYVAVQGETSIVGCGECQRRININDYVTGFSTEASIDSAPGTATITLSIPQNSKNDFFAENEFIIIPMMEIEIYSKGYYAVSGTPQYYRVFWGVVSTVTEAWSDGTATITLTCKDILRWWELTSLTTNPAYLEAFGSSAGNYQLFQNQFSKMNHYAVIASLARDAMGDFLNTTGSFQAFRPERGAEGPAIGQYAADMMAYWQLKFSNIGASLVMYGSSGESYSLSNTPGSVSADQISAAILQDEARKYRENEPTQQLFTNPAEIVGFKQDIQQAGGVEFMQAENMTKLALAFQAREQSGYEFFCDPCGDIVYKPPFYNLNVLPNKPVSWIQDFEILDYSVSDSEDSVVTHVTSSGNAFGGAVDWGINDEITTPRAGAYDFHLLRRYGWRKADLQLEWAGNPRKLFYHLLDWMDKLNAKRHRATITIPHRPELRLGFPIWVPRFDSFWYVEGISHQHSVGGQSTSSLTLSAKRSKFIAPKNIGEIRKIQSSNVPAAGVTPSDNKSQKNKAAKPPTQSTYSIQFPDDRGSSSGQAGTDGASNGPAYIRDPKTGKLLGCPNVVMVYKAAYSAKTLAKLSQAQGSVKGKNSGTQDKKAPQGPAFKRDFVIKGAKQSLEGDQRAKIVAQLRAHRYEAGMTNAGAYDYALDRTRSFKELQLIPVSNLQFGAGSAPGYDMSVSADGEYVIRPPKQGGEAEFDPAAATQNQYKKDAENLGKQVADMQKRATALEKTVRSEKTAKAKANKGGGQVRSKLEDPPAISEGAAPLTSAAESELTELRETIQRYQDTLDSLNRTIANSYTNAAGSKLADLNCMIRPVSDEFGFEVIGHYRYGRGAFIDRNGIQLQSPDTGNIVNQLQIPFSPSGGLLTANPSAGSNLDGSAQSFAAAFEVMGPDDYVTGATFRRASGTSGNAEPEAFTGQASYTSDIENAKDTAVFVDADQRRKSKTLAELSPQTSNGLDSVEYSQCACTMGRTDWWSVLPQSEIAKVVRSMSAATNASSTQSPVGTVRASGGGAPAGTATTSTDAFNVTINQIVEDESKSPSSILSSENNSGSTAAVFADESGQTFFQILRTYLQNDFATKYTQNMQREELYTGGGLKIENDGIDPGRGIESNNLLGDPGSPLFQRAVNGDPDAIRALQNEANLNFGLTSSALSEFKATVSQSPARIQEQFDNPNPAGPPVSVSTDPPPKQYQPPTYPTVKDPINPTNFDSAAKPGIPPGRLQSSLIPDDPEDS